MSEVNHWDRCTTLRQVREHFVGHPERHARFKFYDPRTGNRCAAGMVCQDENGMFIKGSFARVDNALHTGGTEELLIDWNDDYGCDPSKWPVELASDEILDREWA